MDQEIGNEAVTEERLEGEKSSLLKKYGIEGHRLLRRLAIAAKGIPINNSTACRIIIVYVAVHAW